MQALQFDSLRLSWKKQVYSVNKLNTHFTFKSTNTGLDFVSSTCFLVFNFYSTVSQNSLHRVRSRERSITMPLRTVWHNIALHWSLDGWSLCSVLWPSICFIWWLKRFVVMPHICVWTYVIRHTAGFTQKWITFGGITPDLIQLAY